MTANNLRQSLICIIICMILIYVYPAQLHAAGSPSLNGSALKETYDGIRAWPLPIWQRIADNGRYPDDPSSIEIVDTLRIDNSDKDYFAVRLSGYIQAPTTGDYQFFVSGDDLVELYLSTDASEMNKIRIAYTHGKTGVDQWDKYETQASEFITLTEGDLYYFEILHLEVGGSNHASVAWQVDGSEIELIGIEHVVAGGYAGDIDSDRIADTWEQLYFASLVVANGVPQSPTNHDNDGLNDYEEWLLNYDPTNEDTYNRGILDGYAMEGGVFREVWLSQTSSIWDLRISDKFPNAPDKRYFQSGIEVPSNWGDDYATRMRGYMTVPQSGDYRFKIDESDLDSEFWLSTDSSKFNKQLIAAVRGSVPSKHWKGYPRQESEYIYLESGELYYFETLHVEGAFSDYFKLHRKIAGSDYAPIDGTSLISYSIDPNDVDEDELPDSWETTYGFSLETIDTSSDPDLDSLINLEEYMLGSDPTLVDSDADGYSDLEEANLGTSISVADSFTAWEDTTPWQLSDIGQRPASKVLNIDGSMRVMAAGANRSPFWRNEDNYTILSQSISGDFELTVNVDFLRNLYGSLRSHYAGIMVREDLEQGARFISLDVSPQQVFRLCQRSETQGYWSSVSQQTVAEMDALWLKLVRQGDTYTWYRSSENNVWVESGSLTLALPDTIELGMYATAAKPDTFMGVAFNAVSLRLDSDRDGLYDDEETRLGSNPLFEDSDGDGYSDYEETYVYYSDPLVGDMGAESIASETASSEMTSIMGDWETDGIFLHNNSVRGTVQVTLNAPQDGVYRLDLDVSEYENRSSRKYWEFVVSMADGNQFIERKGIEVASDGTATLEVVTPWLPAGNHVFSVLVDNTMLNRSLAIERAKLVYIGGLDGDNDSIPDWMTTRLAALNGIETPDYSYTSPACIEGRSRYSSSIEFHSPWSIPDWQHWLDYGSTHLPGRREFSELPSDRWYANVDLMPLRDTNIAVALENRGYSEVQTVEWKPTNIFGFDSMTIRTGDALRLIAYPEGAKSGRVVIALNDTANTMIYTGVTKPRIVRFNEPGIFNIEASWESDGVIETSNMLLHVLDASFADSPVASMNQARNWTNANVTDGVVVESDWRTHIGVESTSQDAGSNLTIINDSPESRMVAIRAGENGSVIESQTIRALRLKSTTNTGVRFLSSSEAEDIFLVDMDIVLSELHDDVKVVIDIYVAGVTFDDGTIYKELTREDFNELGQATVRFIKPHHTLTSICHHLWIYEDDEAIGGY